MYAYVRFETGDEMSRRKKFAFITWIGPSVSPLKKAKVSTDKAFVKAIVRVSISKTWLVYALLNSLSHAHAHAHARTHTHTHTFSLSLTQTRTLSFSLSQDFGKEILADEKGELKYEKVLSVLEKASGAAYGTGR